MGADRPDVRLRSITNNETVEPPARTLLGLVNMDSRTDAAAGATALERQRYLAGFAVARKLRPDALTGALLVAAQLGWTALALAAARRPELAFKAGGEVLLFLVMWRWFSLLHTAAHQAVFRTRRANELVGLLASVFAFLPYHLWRDTHLGHHKWTGWSGRDPSLSFPAESDAPASLKRAMDLAWRYHLPFFSLYFIIGKFWKQGQPTAATGGAAAPSGAQVTISYLALLGGHGLLFALLGASYLRELALPFLVYLVTSDIVLLNQHSDFHQRQATSEDPPTPLRAADHLQHTRSVLLPELVSRHVFLRFDWHELHHLYPAVPHYHLAVLRPVVGALPNEVKLSSWMRRAQGLPGHRLALCRTRVRV